MKKLIITLLAATLLFGLIGCAKEQEQLQQPIRKPELEQIRSICNLATLECYYHNVAKSVKKAGEGLIHWGEKDRAFWIEYTGIAKLGIDMTQVNISIEGNTVKITLPEATLLSIDIDTNSLSEDSYIASDDGINSNKITAEDQTQAILNAQKNMEEQVKNNAQLLLNAQNRAKEMILNYINQLGELSGLEYQVEWIYENKNGGIE